MPGKKTQTEVEKALKIATETLLMKQTRAYKTMDAQTGAPAATIVASAHSTINKHNKEGEIIARLAGDILIKNAIERLAQSMEKKQ